MRLAYYPETGSLYIDLKSGVAADSHEVADGVIIGLDDKGRLVGIDIDGAAGSIRPVDSGHHRAPRICSTGGASPASDARESD